MKCRLRRVGGWRARGGEAQTSEISDGHRTGIQKGNYEGGAEKPYRACRGRPAMAKMGSRFCTPGCPSSDFTKRNLPQRILQRYAVTIMTPCHGVRVENDSKDMLIG